ncbi:MAG TPA: protein kinase [Polyangiales bacterium]|nr:protein kinase [Polyangiales bacterium]
MTGNSATFEPLPEAAVIAERYEVRALLGRGGMSFVYRVRDLVANREVALKQLVLPSSASKNVVGALFEREFHTLAQLRHPHVIDVYDYGLSDSSSYYTMELLDGGDLRERAPVPWREACRLFFDVCSSIALLHSRRLLHRDISPRNIRCTHDGHAKLIDFGAMAPMNGGAAEVVGTPPFVAPETVQRLALDARTDLFSLGATLYYALTGQLAYRARTFADAMAAWRTKVSPPSTVTPGVPGALDDLVLALIDPEPMRRPQSAFDVMQRLAALAGIEPEESAAVSASYLTTPTLVGRDAHLHEVREQLAAVRMSRAKGLLIHCASGVGRSRMLDAIALEAKTVGFSVLRAAAGVPAEPFAVAHALTRHLLEILPSAALQKLAPTLLEPETHAGTAHEPATGPRLALKQFGDPALDPQPLQDAFCALWTSVSRRWPLVIAVDDLHRIDASSAAVLAEFLDRAHKLPVFVALSSESDDLAKHTVHALARRCSLVELLPLTAAETRALLGALFGEVANLDLLTRELHQIGGGNPRQTIDLAQYLVDRGVIRYVAGTWTLPSMLGAADVPHSFADALRARAQGLSRDARFLAEAQALAFYESFSDATYRELLSEASSQRVERAIGELLAIQALAGDGATYTLANRLWGPALTAALDPAEIAERHRALAAMYRQSSPVAFIYHGFAGGLEEEPLRALMKLNEHYASVINRVEVIEQNVAKMMVCYPRALEVAERIGLGAREINELRRWNLVGSTTAEYSEYPPSGRDWLAQLEHDSGLELYRADTDPDAGQRLMRALGTAQQRHLALDPAERVYSVEEALRRLAEYVAVCIMIGGRAYDTALLSSLPPLLEPFIALSPMLDAIWNNAVATYTMLGTGNLALARERWLRVLPKVDSASSAEMTFAHEIGNAVAFAIGGAEAQLGMPSATSWADRLEKDPYQRVAALQLRRVVRLEHGDAKAAERLRRQVEVLTLQARGPQMFKSLLLNELIACFNAEDLVGIKDALERLRPIAARYRAWLPHVCYAEGCFHLVRGDSQAARLKYEECIELGERGTLMWYAGTAGLGEALLALDRLAEGRAKLQEALDLQSQQQGVTPTVELVRSLALADAKLGRPDAALSLEASVAEQQRLGASGVRLGRSFEARAQIALWQGDAVAFARYAELTAREYRYGAGSALGARYQRLMNEARRRGLQPAAARGELSPMNTVEGSAALAGEIKTLVLLTMSHEASGPGRARAALEMICAAHGAKRGLLYVHVNAGLVRAASIGAEPPPPELAQLQELIIRAGERASELDEMTTDALSQESAGESIEVGAIRYELLLLSCAVANENRVAGVAAVEGGAGTVDRVRSVQLRHALAGHILAAADGSSAFLE